jgi:DNA primase
MSSTVEQIKERLGITEVVGQYLKLERAGVNFRARCPFHNERTPSFFVSPTRGSWHCFGCNRGGDLISFVEEIEGIDFLGALKILAAQAGVDLAVYDRREVGETDRLFKALDLATKFFETKLLTNEAVKKYLVERGLTEETIRAWRLGFAPDDWRHAADELIRQGYSEQELTAVGLTVTAAKNPASRPYERFRRRIMFPLFDSAGRVTGFSGRIFPASPAGRGGDSDNEAKYVNSPETKLYKKSQILFGFDRAKMAIRQADTAILVEGQMDLLMAHQAGLTNTVAVSGTALTTEHLVKIHRLAGNLVMSFDSDEAGIKAAKKSIDLALALGFNVKAAALPAGQDPAEVIKTDPEIFRRAVAEAKHIINFHLDNLKAKTSDRQQLAKLVTSEVLPYVKQLANNLEQAHFVDHIATAIKLPADSLWRELVKVEVLTTPRSDLKNFPRSDLEIETVVENRADRIKKLLFGILAWQKKLPKPMIELDDLTARLAEVASPTELDRQVAAAEVNQELLFEVELSYAGSTRLADEVDELIANFKQEQLKGDLTVALAELREAESDQDQARLDSALKKCQDIGKALQALTNHN